MKLQNEKITAHGVFGVFDDFEQEISYSGEEEEMLSKMTAVADHIHFVGIDPFFNRLQ